MSKLILSKHDCLQLFLKTRYITEFHNNPFTEGMVYESLTEDDTEDD
ncbi:MAG: hypothetical protein JSV49_02565 [Thermoplasmata archaeon]|nr:MAG: hypothetical protein JSV49_02565 [Thermoplasmata archaeon]